MPEAEIQTLEALQALLRKQRSLSGKVLQALDLRGRDAWFDGVDLSDLVLVGCACSSALTLRFAAAGALSFPNLPDVPFRYRSALYTPGELFDRYRPGDHASYAECLDARVYEYYVAHGKALGAAARVTLAQRLHDHGITDALQELVAGQRVAAIMGGHSMLRTDPAYRKVACLARKLTRRGLMLATGGGPGAMEAAHLGAWFASRGDNSLDDALTMLAAAPSYQPFGPWLDSAFAVLEKYPALAHQPQSLGIPTWHYGHEPPTVFATHIAKYFANSVREDGLLEIATQGVVYAPGSAGTIQEVFQDAAQNHYESVGFPSPMVFLGVHFWTQQHPVVPLLTALAQGRRYQRLISTTDQIDEVVNTLRSFSPAEPAPLSPTEPA